MCNPLLAVAGALAVIAAVEAVGGTLALLAICSGALKDAPLAVKAPAVVAAIPMAAVYDAAGVPTAWFERGDGAVFGTNGGEPS